MRRVHLGLVSAVLVLLIVGCALHPSTEAVVAEIGPIEGSMAAAVPVREVLPAGEAEADGELVIVLRNAVFQPRQIVVAPGTTVTWINDDAVDHTVTSGTRRNPTEAFGEQLSEDESFSFTFENVGSYDYHCSMHLGMKGTVIVE